MVTNGMRETTHQNWIKEAIELYGNDPKQWKFICPVCKTVQTIQDFIDAGVGKETISKTIAFSCIGRFTKTKGCDWTLGGLFRLHTLEVKFEDEEKGRPTFEFADRSSETKGE